MKTVIFAIFFLASLGGAAAADALIKSPYQTFISVLRATTPPKRTAPVIIRLRSASQPLVLRSLPDHQSDIAAYFDPKTRYVAILIGCRNQWCHVRIGSILGWLRESRLDVGEPASDPSERSYYDRFQDDRWEDFDDDPIDISDDEFPEESFEDEPYPGGVANFKERHLETSGKQAEKTPEKLEIRTVPRTQTTAPVANAAFVNVPLPAWKERRAPQTSPDEPTITKQSDKPAPFRQVIEDREIQVRPETGTNGSFKLSDIPKRKYSLQNTENMTFLPVRLDRAEDAPIVGGIPYFADDVEASGLCVDDWCLVERGPQVRGWIRYAHLSDKRPAKQPKLKLKRMNEHTEVALRAEPDESADVVSYIAPDTRNIVPAMECNVEWCQVSLDERIGWIESKHLSRQ
ncbi:MAG: hypothetical protein KTR19_09760 [Hyphomicrobiales bacterium]|nr:hypothetical protein [Hyphomicrobiales bacterium]